MSACFSLSVRWLYPSSLSPAVVPSDEWFRTRRCLFTSSGFSAGVPLRRRRRVARHGSTLFNALALQGTQKRTFISTTATPSTNARISGASRSAAEAAFEAAMFGGSIRSSLVAAQDAKKVGSTGNDDGNATARCAAPTTTVATPTLPAPLNSPRASVATFSTEETPQSGTEGRRGRGAAGASSFPIPVVHYVETALPDDTDKQRCSAASSTPASSLFTVQQQQRREKRQTASSSSSLSEEAFERAMYSEFFGAPHTSTTATANCGVTTTATETEAQPTTTDSGGVTAARESNREISAHGSAGAFCAHPSANAAAVSEAAFERALFGAVEPEKAVGVERESVLPSSFLYAARHENDNAVSPRSAVAGAQDAESAAAIRTCEVPWATAATPNGGHDSSVVHAELTRENGSDFEEDRRLFETDTHETPSLFSLPENTSLTARSKQDDKAADAQRRKRRGNAREESQEDDKADAHNSDDEDDDDASVKQLSPPPPPTVSMTCPFASEDGDSGSAARDGAITLSDALFGLTDHHTSVVTHLDPADRVELCMPLLDRASKRDLFYESGWLLELQEQENAWISGVKAATGAQEAHVATGAEDKSGAPAPTATCAPSSFDSAAADAAARPLPPPTHREVVGRSKVLRCLVYRLLRAPHLWWDLVQELVWMAVEEAKARDNGKSEGQRGLSEEVSVEVSLDNILSTELESPPRSDATTVFDADTAPLFRVLTEQQMRTAMTRVFGDRPSNVHFFSGALQRELVAMYDATLHPTQSPADDASSASRSVPATASFSSSFSSAPLSLSAAFTGPAAAWRGFVLTHRLSQTQVCGPHVMPFSYGELRPTITAAELAPLCYCGAEASWPAPARDAPHPTSETETQAASEGLSTTDVSSSLAKRFGEEAGQGGRVTKVSHPWAEMNEAEQNTFLFGEAAAQLSAQLRSSDGIFLVYGQDGVTFEEEEKFHAAEEALRRAEEEEKARLLDGEDGSPVGRRQSPLERVCAEELARVRLYDVDRVVLELTDTEGRSGDSSIGSDQSSSAFLDCVAFPALTMSPSSAAGRGGGRGRRSSRPATKPLPFQLHLQNKEDVQLAALWQRFSHSSTDSLVDCLVHVRRRASELVRDAVIEVAVQKAFWLLFYARDEVRAVTDPRRTYETVWNLHDQLLEVLTLPFPKSSVSRASATEGAAARPTFACLSRSNQVTYACFGCAHMPPHRRGGGTAPASVLPSPSKAPHELYMALVKERYGSGDAVLQGGEAGRVLDSDAAAAHASDTLQTLSALQKMAVSFCFPQNAVEEAEMALRGAPDSTGGDDGRCGASAASEPALFTLTDAAAVGVRAPLSLRSHGKNRSRILQWMHEAREHLRAARIAQAAHLQKQPGQPSAAEKGATEDALSSLREKENEGITETASLTLEDEEPAASASSGGAPTSAEAEARRRALTQQQMRDAVQASVYRCLCSLRATGMLLHSLPAATGSAPLFTAAQQMVIEQAVAAIVASLHESPSDSVGNVDTNVDPGAVTAAPAAPSPGSGRQKLSLSKRDDAAVQPPAKRRRGRPPRSINPDGTYTKAPYVHSAAYFARKKEKEIKNEEMKAARGHAEVIPCEKNAAKDRRERASERVE